MRLSRRTFLSHASSAGLILGALSGAARAQNAASGNVSLDRYGPLISDPKGLLDLPQGFSYTMISETGQAMSDGLRTPSRPDGMACFEGPTPGTVVLVRNHENYWVDRPGSAFDEVLPSTGSVPRDMIYDFHPDGPPSPGGTTTILYDLVSKRILRSHLSLAGTLVNCAGGATPWGSWLTCEEIFRGTAEGLLKDHGFVFEVPSSATGPVPPVPLTAMGRFVHEACAIDPVSHAVYMTEDAYDALLYRFLPTVPEELSAGGRLQALSLVGDVPSDTRNWTDEDGGLGAESFPLGQKISVRWVEIDDPEAKLQETRLAGAAAGAAIFARGEGITFALGDDGRSIFFACTEGGSRRLGQIWQYRPGSNEGTETGAETSGTLELVYQSDDVSVLENVDNITFAPWHDLILCEDGAGENFLRGLTPEGRIYNIARNAHEDQAEFCGACFSPDGSALFVNVQVPGFTYAITGPWDLVHTG